MTFLELPHSGREPHRWRLRRAGFRELLLAKRWRMKGAYAEKTIAGRTVMLRTIEEGADFTICCVQLKADFVAELTARACERAAKEGQGKRPTSPERNHKSPPSPPVTTPTGTKPKRTAEEQSCIDAVARMNGKDWAESHAELILDQSRSIGDL